METVDDQQLFLFSEVDSFFLASSFGDSDREPLFKVVTAVEDFWEEEVEKGPKLSQVILQRGSCEKQAMAAVILLSEYPCKFAFRIFHFMSLVDNDVFPIIFVESESIFEDEVVSGDAYIPFGTLHDLQDLVSGCRVTSVHYFAD